MIMCSDSLPELLVWKSLLITSVALVFIFYIFVTIILIISSGSLLIISLLICSKIKAVAVCGVSSVRTVTYLSTLSSHYRDLLR